MSRAFIMLFFLDFSLYQAFTIICKIFIPHKLEIIILKSALCGIILLFVWTYDANSNKQVKSNLINNNNYKNSQKMY